MRFGGLISRALLSPPQPPLSPPAAAAPAAALSYTLEASFYASNAEVTTTSSAGAFGATSVATQTKQTLVPFTPASYQQLGRDLALSFADYYELDS